MSDERKQITASEVQQRWKEWAEGVRQDPAKRIAIAKLAAKRGDMNALDALAEIALKHVTECTRKDTSQD